MADFEEEKVVEGEATDDESASEALPYQYTISSYGADYPVDGLVKRLDRKDIFVPHFQRKYVWKLPQASRFIESLLLGLPVPGVFFGKKEKTNELIIIDGQQRLLTLKYFCDGVFADSGREFALRGVQGHLIGLTYKTLDDDQRRKLDDSIIHATIVKQEEPSDDESSIYLVFERLNTGGTPLSEQEIRTSVSYGKLVGLLEELNSNPDWRELFGRESKRMKDQELILRFFALSDNLEAYSRPMKGFLNSYMERNSDLDDNTRATRTSQFQDVVCFLNRVVGKRAFRPKSALNAAVYDAIMVGTSRRLAKGPIDERAYVAAFEKLMQDENFESEYTKSTADEGQVKGRIGRATDAFGALA